LQARSRSVVSVAGLVVILGLLPGCLDAHTWVQKEKPWTQSTLGDTDRVRVKRSDGTGITLEQPRIDHDEQGDFLTGRGKPLSNQEVRIDLATIRSLEVREVDSGKAAAGIVLGAIALYLLSPFLPSA